MALWNFELLYVTNGWFLPQFSEQGPHQKRFKSLQSIIYILGSVFSSKTTYKIFLLSTISSHILS
jgi:hypothetical protein